MRQSRLFMPTLREAPAEAEAASHRLMIRGGLIRQLSAGVYTYLPLAWRSLRKLEGIIREEMERAGGQELHLPAMQPADLWRASGRYDDYGPELIRFPDRHGREFALGPTHEEVITTLVAEEVSTYRKLPLLLYQIQTKYRDELRPRFGLMRGREFLMKDAYSFDTDWQSLDVVYKRMHEAYKRIFTRCGLDYRDVEADSGTIGGEGETHEFIALSAMGEDTIVLCPACSYAANVEVASCREGEPCPRCGDVITERRGIEIGHIFKLGMKYSAKLNASYTDAAGRSRTIVMGCYGIGVSRLLAAVIEQHHDADGIRWPASLAPFRVHLIPVSVKDEQQMQTAEHLYNRLQAAGIDVLLDDRDERFGVKLKDADLIGMPLRIVVGRDAAVGNVEVKSRGEADSASLSVNEAFDLAKRMMG